jgi:hypothetical protein
LRQSCCSPLGSGPAFTTLPISATVWN